MPMALVPPSHIQPPSPLAPTVGDILVSRRAAFWEESCSLCFCVTGCEPKFPQVTPNRSKRTVQSNIDSHLENVMNFLNHQEESEPSGMRRTILLKLNEC